MKLSIITINRNNASGLEKTIQSVVCQSFTDFEYIIIDGASDDDSVEIIKKYIQKIDYWISEPDTGIYAAMNKGARKAQGEYCLFLNSGDWLVSPSTLETVFKEISGYIPSDIFYSDRINSDGMVYHYPENISVNYLLNRTISHQNSLIRRSLFLEHGYYNENLKIASDWEFFLKESWEYKTKYFHIKTNICVFDINGIGSKASPIRVTEHMIVLQNVFNELSDSIMELSEYRRTTYYNIIENYGDTHFLTFILRVYKLFIIIIRQIARFFRKLTGKLS
jgi:glycosyltransferase involved in cell wall biosynthesis